MAPEAEMATARPWLRAEGLALMAAAAGAYAVLDGNWWAFALLFLAPDLTMLGYLGGPRLGAALYNAGHSTIGPLALAAAGSAWWPAALPVAMIWLAHIGFDRALGYGLKSPAGFGVTHLGRVGRRAEAAG
ncbi:DUF4260 domain-containing protein [Roseomonas eburnea]|uniref:DUF4260 domain-containing protein n=1 Tax=Neoroseomonas eburnea TaxID=1346889 RepID=A0A9X9XCR0_9PROT|nr:DUF4260 domain-containing protein [Neoroseomonas eburnea]MBR0681496.1 DUF4260 domain-containing protein [Neoroseomonas eburnea]